MESVPTFNESKASFDESLLESCDFVIPTKEVAEFASLIFNPLEDILVSYAIPAVAVFGILSNMALIFVLISAYTTCVRWSISFSRIWQLADIGALANNLGLGIWNAYYSPVNNSMPFTTSLGCGLFNWEGSACARLQFDRIRDTDDN